MKITSSDVTLICAYLSRELTSKHLSRPCLYTHNTLFFHTTNNNFHRLTISLDPNNPRVYLSETDINASTLETPFYSSIKKELGNAYVTGITSINDDRLIRISFTIINSVYKEEGRSLVVELLPHHSNLIILDEQDKIISLYRPSDLESKRPLLRNMSYVPPTKSFVNNSLDNDFNLKDYFSECDKEEQDLFASRKKERFGPLSDYFKRLQKSLTRKIELLQKEIEQASQHVNDGQYGDYLYTNNIDVKQGQIDVDGVILTLDPTKSLSLNADSFYKKAKKAKMTLIEGEKNLELTKKKLLELDNASSLLLQADENGLETLAKQWGLLEPLKNEKKKENSLSSSVLPSFVNFGNTKIVFGKNAKQNDCLTFLLDTSKKHVWLHVNGASGSHVMIKKDNPTTEEISMAAQIALLNSSLQEGEVLLALRGDVNKTSTPGLVSLRKSEVKRFKVTKEANDLLLTAQKYEL
jgi:predicted ribosome quality control (RQC) complex YloA/Tae2 family protein